MSDLIEGGPLQADSYTCAERPDRQVHDDDRLNEMNAKCILFR